jgi:hypothetical protein
MSAIRRFAPAALALLASAASAAAQEGGQPPDPARSSRDDLLEEYEERLAEVERRLAAAERPKPVLRLLDISLSGLFAAGGSTASEEDLASLQGGGHDPHKRGFTVQNVELAISGAVDPYLRGDLYLITFIDPEGETAVELEEAYLTTTSLPAGLQVRAGHFFTEFGRLNPSHPHSWDFVDQPVINTRMFGPDGMRAPGARLSWLAPTDVPLELFATVQNANGETMTSFLGTEEEEQVGGRPWTDATVHSMADLVYSGRAQASLDLSKETVALVGASGSAGPNATGGSGRTRILGGDLTLKWKPAANDQGFPFVTWQTEAMTRRFHADEYLVAGEPYFPHESLHDAGFYSQATWGFRRGWTAGVRWDQADGMHGDPHSDPLRERRTRAAAALTWYPSEFAKIRLQVNRDRSESLGESTSVWLQFEFLLGAHGAHKF